MSDGIRMRVKEQAESIPAPQGDLKDVISAGSRLQTRRRAMQAVATAGTLVSVGIGLFFLLPALNSQNPRTDGGQAIEPAGPASVRDVEAFAIEALSTARLQEPEGTMADYLDTVDADGAWVVRLNVFDCSVTPCGDKGPAEARIERRGEGFVVAEVSGSLSESEKSRLRGHSGSPTDHGTGVVFDEPQYYSLQDGAPAASIAHYWKGSLASDLEVKCTLRGYSESGETVLNEEAVYKAPLQEGARDGFVKLPLPEDVVSVEMTCP